jgi:glycosidase
MYEFHISRYARNKYEFDQAIYQFNGNAILADFHAARAFAHRMNTRRDLLAYPEQAVQAGEVNAMGLIDEILHAVIAEYRRTTDPHIMRSALARLEAAFGATAIRAALDHFTGHFPPAAVYRAEHTVDEYLSGKTASTPHREIALEELLMLWLSNANPALGKFGELFDDAPLETQTVYNGIIRELQAFFREAEPAQPGAAGGGSLMDVLRAPAVNHPDSLFAQLDFLIQKFPQILTRYQLRLLRSLDLLREETKPGWQGPAPAHIPQFTRLADDDAAPEYEAYSPDTEWMPRLVLIAKNAYVWLDQLSKQYSREIRTLDAIPGEELDTLAARGFNGLWLIGLWERSPASARIKHLTGNADAVASAYSLYDYEIARALGGDPALETLRQRAAARGIRLAADMVPNHTGIYSRWVLEHPDWFLALDHPPYPAYTFHGPDLSEDPAVSLHIEDHYYQRSDAAVVFKRHDHRTGRTQYIYHGNDGTSMPWNDTAQINYLHPPAREAVIQMILGVARKFPVIRFDAAMTLARKHIQRLWFPEPGSGGAIPSRAEHSLPRARFDELLPNEFWREVVDRVAQEVPGTLLLAEAFWLMEGYFVRTLGMHRVYNSAFMNMLRDEKNAEYRQVIKNTIEFDPEILKRYVNFMNNPDEDTAIEQFGDGGKYFGVCVLMSTLPGLPMFGHGQVEGYTEKYGMEYQRAYYNEQPKGWLVERHLREIAPLLHKRYLFAEVGNFLLYDLVTPGGAAADVFAYSNRFGGERALVLVHNKWAEVRGALHRSSPFATRDGDDLQQTTRTLAEGLALPDDPAQFVIFRDHISGLEYIRPCAEMHRRGLEVHLGGYEYRVFLDFRLVPENEWSHYRMLAEFLDGRGVHDLEALRQELILQPVLQPFRELVNPGFFGWVIESAQPGDGSADTGADTASRRDETLRQAGEKLDALLTGISGYAQLDGDTDTLRGEMLATFSGALETFRGEPAPGTGFDPVSWGVLFSWVFAHPLGKVVSPDGFAVRSRSWLDEWLFGRVIGGTLSALGGGEAELALVKLLVGREAGWFAASALDTLKGWLNDADIARFLGVNRYQGVLWYDRDAFKRLVTWAGHLAALAGAPAHQVDDLLAAADVAGYQVEPLLAALEPVASPEDDLVDSDALADNTENYTPGEPPK